MALATVNLASKYATKVDERFTRQSQAAMALNNDYEFTGVKTVNVYSIPVVPFVDFDRNSLNGYGTPSELTNTIQTLTIQKDMAATFKIDKGNKLQSQMVMEAGTALRRQTDESWIPLYDTYIFKTLADAAIAAGNTDTTTPTKENAYSLFLNAMEHLGNANVPDQGRVCFCTYGFANLLKQDTAFMKYSQLSQEMVIKGVIGEVDGCKIVKVPASRLPAGAAFLITHPSAATAPKQLEEFKTHADPPGISGWLCEIRIIFDCFVLDNKTDAIFYQGGAASVKTLKVQSTANGTAAGQTTISLIPGEHDSNGAKWYYHMATTKSGLNGVTYGTAITTSAWTELTAATLAVAASSNTVVEVVEVDSANKPLAYGTAKVNKV